MLERPRLRDESDDVRGWATVAVGVGAAFGATLRWGVAELMPWDGSGVPWTTLIVNLVGALLIGVAAARLRTGSLGWALVVTGVLGGLTTASALSEETRRLAAASRPGLAGAYVVVTVLAGVLAVGTGERVGRRRTSGSER